MVNNNLVYDRTYTNTRPPRYYIERFTDNSWETLRGMSELNNGDVFRMYYDNVFVTDSRGSTLFQATSEPYLITMTEGNESWITFTIDSISLH